MAPALRDRTARLGLLSVLAVLIGGSAHTQAGGGRPAVAALLVAALISAPLVWGIARHRFTFARTAPVVAAQQLVLHLTYSVMTPMTGGGHGSPAAGTMPAGDHTGHTMPAGQMHHGTGHGVGHGAGHDAGASLQAGGEHAGSHGVAMLFWHVLAALVVAWLVCEAERLAHAVAGLLSPVRLLWLPLSFRTPRRVSPIRSLPVPTPHERDGVHRHRGPPVLLGA